MARTYAALKQLESIQGQLARHGAAEASVNPNGSSRSRLLRMTERLLSSGLRAIQADQPSSPKPQPTVEATPAPDPNLQKQVTQIDDRLETVARHQADRLSTLQSQIEGELCQRISQLEQRVEVEAASLPAQIEARIEAQVESAIQRLRRQLALAIAPLAAILGFLLVHILRTP